MSTRFYGSLNISEVFDLLNKKHSAFSKGDNGKVYASVNVWLSDEPDKFGNVLSIQLNTSKDLREKDGQPYIGNCKEAQKQQVTSRDAGQFSIPNDIPVRDNNVASDISEPISDLPF